MTKTTAEVVRERMELAQEVIDRILKYGDEYKNELNSMNDKFPVKKEFDRVNNQFSYPKK